MSERQKAQDLGQFWMKVAEGKEGKDQNFDWNSKEKDVKEIMTDFQMTQFLLVCLRDRRNIFTKPVRGAFQKTRSPGSLPEFHFVYGMF